MARDVQVEVGARGIRGVDKSAKPSIGDATVTGQIIESAQNGEGELFWNRNPNDWILCRNIPSLQNANGEVVREALRVEIKFENNLTLIREDDPYKDEKIKKLKSMPGWGTTIRPMNEIHNENKAKAQAEAIRVLTTIGDNAALAEILEKLAAKVEQTPEIKEVLANVRGQIKPEPKTQIVG